MRRVMSVGELKRYYEGRSVRRILFCTENQSWDNVENPMKVIESSSVMLISSVSEGLPMCALEALALKVPIYG